jgi:hypothetical protein
MSEVTSFVWGAVVGAGIGYVVAWNIAKHPGKLTAQFKSLWNKVRRKEPTP